MCCAFIDVCCLLLAMRCFGWLMCVASSVLFCVGYCLLSFVVGVMCFVLSVVYYLLCWCFFVCCLLFVVEGVLLDICCSFCVVC